jgi:thioredoxin
METTNDVNFEQMITTNEWALVEWWAEWCAACKAMFAKLAEVAEDYKGRVAVIALDVAKEEGISQKYGVLGLPCFTLFHNGKPVSSKPGVQTVSQLTEWIDRTIEQAKVDLNEDK